MKGIQFLLFLMAICVFSYFFYQKCVWGKFSENKTDIIVFSYHRPMQLYAFLESMQVYSKNHANVFVVYRSETPRFDAAYNLVKDTFKDYRFIKQSKIDPNKDFKKIVMDLAFNTKKSRSKYICFAVDDILIRDKIDFDEAILALEKSKAYGFFFRLGSEISYCYMLQMDNKIPPLAQLDEKYLVFRFCDGTGDWNYPNSLDMTIYRKKDIYKDIKKIQFTFPTDFEAIWNQYRDHKHIGICYQKSKIINLPLNIVSKFQKRNMNQLSVEDLLNFFEKGYKFDISKVHTIKNHSPHFEYIPEMIIR